MQGSIGRSAPALQRSGLPERGEARKEQKQNTSMATSSGFMIAEAEDAFPCAFGSVSLLMGWALDLTGSRYELRC
jgi:hypothetical protein